jgi:DNA-binding GntR family transcriptional regulator
MPKTGAMVRAGVTLRRETLSAQVTRFLRDAIITGKFAEGDRLIESEIAAMTEASYTPIREALLALEAEGLVCITPHRGAAVSSMSEEELTELYAIRASLESLAARTAAPFMTAADFRNLESAVKKNLSLVDAGDLEGAFRAAHEFHEYYLTKSPFQHLLRILRGLTSQLMRYSFSAIRQNPGRLRRIAREHQQIITALRNRKPAGDCPLTRVVRLDLAKGDRFAGGVAIPHGSQCS